MIRNVAQAIIFEWQQAGWRATLKLCLETFVQLREVYVMRQTLKKPIPVVKLKAGIRIRQSTLADQALWQTLVPAYRARRFAQKMQAGEVCFIALEGERVIGIFWAAFTDSPSVKQIPIEIEPNEAYLWGAYVRPDRRSIGVATMLARTTAQWLKEHGYEKTVQLTEQSNTTAIKLALGAGNEPATQYTILRFLKWRRIRFHCVKLLLTT